MSGQFGAFPSWQYRLIRISLPACGRSLSTAAIRIPPGKPQIECFDRDDSGFDLKNATRPDPHSCNPAAQSRDYGSAHLPAMRGHNKAHRPARGTTFNPSPSAAFRCLMSKLKNTLAPKISAAATCRRSEVRVPIVGLYFSASLTAASCNAAGGTGVGTKSSLLMSPSISRHTSLRRGSVICLRNTAR